MFPEDTGNKRMQEIASAIEEEEAMVGLSQQYRTIAVVSIIFMCLILFFPDNGPKIAVGFSGRLCQFCSCRVCRDLCALDEVGNTTKAVTKGYAIDSAARGVLAFFCGLSHQIKPCRTIPEH